MLDIKFLPWQGPHFKALQGIWLDGTWHRFTEGVIAFTQIVAESLGHDAGFSILEPGICLILLTSCSEIAQEYIGKVEGLPT